MKQKCKKHNIIYEADIFKAIAKTEGNCCGKCAIEKLKNLKNRKEKNERIRAKLQ